ncbi:Transferase protein [Dioscorea alata]|uniref:Transferase protein n=1 Tax=Dioscorea alata TaxID=55571 RepID=A0ACB7UTX1_DIOAL|nr:Transferase protein [Dioscorea alata]
MLMVDCLLVFNLSQEPTKIIREALSKALVPYFPVAEEFTFSDQGQLSVSCTGRGVWFIGALANFPLKDINMFIKHQEFLPQPPLCIDPTDHMCWNLIEEQREAAKLLCEVFLRICLNVLICVCLLLLCLEPML